ncbi:MAG TPA: bifunctional demethylmenaquinone methyltransferase/2-methoxy-6-polyprenyl-1,4-benzoquinol methylase UbiE [Verrucomicrobiota bacterium]|nr:bifunctional demethylmenaquinone methyltransferase/2-methoxy-6-polyprenyl-1,4-benzoquinol methylase UbiE [Verrucomicrobiota bacterium]
MSNEYYAPGGQRAQRVSDLFGRIARRYDLINDLQSFGLHRLWKRRVVELASVRAGDRALDVCCGTGDIAFALTARGADVIGLDFSEAMLEVARKKSPKAELRNPEFIRGDAMRLPFPDASFHAVTVGYGLRNLADWEVGLNEMARVAKPGGRMVVLEFGKPANAVWRALYFCYLRLAVPVFGLLFCGDLAAYSYILESLRHYPAQKGVERKMRDLGLTNIRVINLLGGAMSINCGEKSR